MNEAMQLKLTRLWAIMWWTTPITSEHTQRHTCTHQRLLANRCSCLQWMHNSTRLANTLCHHSWFLASAQMCYKTNNHPFEKGHSHWHQFYKWNKLWQFLVLDFCFSCHLKAKIRGHEWNNYMCMAACFERLVPDFSVGVRDDWRNTA